MCPFAESRWNPTGGESSVRVLLRVGQWMMTAVRVASEPSASRVPNCLPADSRQHLFTQAKPPRHTEATCVGDGVFEQCARPHDGKGGRRWPHGSAHSRWIRVRRDHPHHVRPRGGAPSLCATAQVGGANGSRRAQKRRRQAVSRTEQKPKITESFDFCESRKHRVVKYYLTTTYDWAPRLISPAKTVNFESLSRRPFEHPLRRSR